MKRDYPILDTATFNRLDLRYQLAARPIQAQLEYSETGRIIYDGPSLLDGSPIVAIAILASGNRKTGDMVQTYILRRDMTPIVAVAEGRDDAICGNCPHRGASANGKGRTCYVTIAQGPTVVFKGYRANRYQRLTDPGEIALLGRNRAVRLGTYGDPAAVPVWVWQSLTRYATRRSGYTHQWKTCDPALSALCMASVDSLAERDSASAAGWRTFRIRRADDPVLPSEFVCPASDEGKHVVQCERCGLCNGASKAKSPVIIAHGTGARFFSLSTV